MDLSVDSMCLNFDCSAFVKNFIANVVSEQDPDGSLTDVVPYVRFGGRPADVSWSAALIQQIYVLFKEENDLSMAKKYYPQMLLQLDNVAGQAKAGLGSMHTP